MKNRILALLLCFIITLGFTACNNSKSEKEIEKQIQNAVSEEMEKYISKQEKQTNSSIAKAVNKKSVYWTPNGKSYHTTKSCPHLSRSKVIKNTSLQRAYEEGKKDPCNTCVKQ